MSDSNFMADPVLLFSSRWASSPFPHGIHLLPKAILNLGICFYFSKKCQRQKSLHFQSPHYCSRLLLRLPCPMVPVYSLVSGSLLCLWFTIFACFQSLPSDLASDSLMHISAAWFLSPWFYFDCEILGASSLALAFSHLASFILCFCPVAAHRSMNFFWSPKLIIVM